MAQTKKEIETKLEKLSDRLDQDEHRMEVSDYYDMLMEAFGLVEDSLGALEQTEVELFNEQTLYNTLHRKRRRLFAENDRLRHALKKTVERWKALNKK